MIVWTDYIRYRARLRGFDLARIEQIVRYSAERYFDTVTGRRIVVGRHDRELVVIAYEEIEEVITPVTIHATTHQQVSFRLRTGRFTNV
jgi:DNA-directed RNA polymerase subunit K/omega